MQKKRTPTKPQKPRKIAPKPECWPAYAYEDNGHLWAREAIRYGNAEILAKYLWQADEIDPRVRRELAEMLNPTSNHVWRLDVRYRFLGKPTKLAKYLKLLFNETIVNFTKHLSGEDPLRPQMPSSTFRYARSGIGFRIAARLQAAKTWQAASCTSAKILPGSCTSSHRDRSGNAHYSPYSTYPRGGKNWK